MRNPEQIHWQALLRAGSRPEWNALDRVFVYAKNEPHPLAQGNLIIQQGL